jgi:hypothetical protein
MSQKRWSGVISWTSLVLLMISVGLNALQAARIRDLVAPANKLTSTVGRMAPPLNGVTPDGRRQIVRFDQGHPG